MSNDGDKLQENDHTRKKTECSTEILTNAANDIRILISYLARRPHPEEILPHFTWQYADAVLNGDRSEEVEAALWAQLSALSAAAAPASAESIKDSKYFKVIYGYEDPEARRSRGSRFQIGIFALIAFFLAFLIGGYTQLTSVAVGELEADLTEWSHMAAHEWADTRYGRYDASTELNDSEKANAKYNALVELQSEIGGGYNILGIAALFSPAITTASLKGPDGARFDLFNRVTIDVQRNINLLLADFLIPALASFLGVAVYIIRDTTQRLESVSMSPMDEVAYWPRIILGLIAGLTIGWLMPSAGLLPPGDGAGGSEAVVATVGSLSKTAVAFVVGYSIEVLFNLLDAIKGALGVRDEKATPVAPQDK